MQLMVATRNPGKRREFGVLLDSLLPEGAQVTDIASWPSDLPEVVEDGDTFVQNAFKKAWETSQLTGCTTLADDSGIVIDALDGRPGVHSARYAGEDASDAANNSRMLEELRNVPAEQRTAHYVGVLCLVIAPDSLGRALLYRLGRSAPLPTPRDAESLRPPASQDEFVDIGDRVVVWTRAECSGRIVDEPRGDGGFGYDPHFFIDEWGQTMAEVSLQKKNELSHRAAAARQLGALFE